MKDSKLNQAAALAEKKAAAAAAKAKAEVAEREELESQAAFNVGAEARRQKYMKDWLAQFDDAAAEAALIAARADFETAVQADPMMATYLELCRLYKRRGDDGQIATNFASLVGVPAPRCDAGHDLPTANYLMQWAMEHLASRREDERVAEVFEAREAAANGDGDE